MKNKELVLLVPRISMYTALAILTGTAVWFILRVVFLTKKHGMAIEDALDSAANSVMGVHQKLENLPKKIQKAQLSAISPEFQMCIQYYELRLKCWLHNKGLL